MSETLQNGGPAFPGYTMEEDGEKVILTKLNPGMTLRDYFAGQALVGLTPDAVQLANLSMQQIEAVAGRLATQSYVLAETMLAARDTEESEVRRLRAANAELLAVLEMAHPLLAVGAEAIDRAQPNDHRMADLLIRIDAAVASVKDAQP